MKMKNKKGFTLIELVIVVAVLAVLAAVAVPVVGNIIDNASESADATNVALMQGAIERYKAETGAYPANASGAVAAIKKYTNLKTVEGKDLFAAPKSESGKAFIYNVTTEDGKIVKGEISIGTPSGTGDNAISETKQ